MTSNCCILVVDDEPIVGKSLQRLLSKAGYAVKAFSDSRAAVEELGKMHFDFIITDLMMDGFDGMQILEIVKEKCPDTKVIIITGFAEELTAEDALQRGAFAFFQKPFKIDDIKQVIRQAVEK